MINQLKPIATNTLQAFGLSISQPAPASVRPHFEGKASARHWWLDQVIKHKPSKPFASGLNNGYDKDLSKNHVSGQPIRYLSAFFVPDICLASQAKQFISTLNNLSQVKTVISKMIYSSNSYDGVTLQNTRALGQICRAVADVTESEPHHPMIFHSVVSTQKTTSGGSYHG